MRMIAPLALALMAAPAFGDTLKEVTTRGVVFTAGNAKFDIAFAPNGTMTISQVVADGAWTIEGDKLCTIPATSGMKDCAVYPKDKKSGDEFKLMTPQGEVTVRIK